MSGGIYLVHSDGGLVEMSEQDYASEELLQELLAKYPNLLAGEQISSDDPRRWLLVSREASLASEEDGSGRWSVDHLFLDQDAIPTIVEVKRSTDTRIRREVVGQMLDYAANAVVYWPVESLRARFEDAREDHEHDLSELLDDPDADLDGFWRKVKTNLQAGKVRLMFVADEVPIELRRVVEFLNQQMDPAEVLAIEIKQYVGGDMKTLVPRVIGQTVEAQQKKFGAVREGRQWNEETFFAQLESDPVGREVAGRILNWSKSRMPSIWWGKGKRSGSFTPGLVHKGKWCQLIRVSTDLGVEFQFEYMRKAPPFDKEPERLRLLQKINEIPGINLAEEAIKRRPSVPLSVFENEVALDELLKTLNWAVQEIKSS